MTPVRALAARVAEPAGRILVVTDFDGTIAEIDLDPTAARIEPGALRALRRLARFAQARPDRLVVAVLTGRAVADVAGRIRVGGLHYLGNHGLEAAWLPRGGRVDALVAEGPARDPAGPAARLARLVASRLGDPDWLFIERKDPSVAFHYRQAAMPAEAGRLVSAAVDAALAETPGLERSDSRMIVELRPVGAGGKGAAVARLAAEVRPVSVLALGDDRSDAEGFRVLSAKRAAGRLASLSIGVHDHHATPRELLDAADEMFENPRQTGRLLNALATVLEHEQATSGPRGPQSAIGSRFGP